MTRLEMIVLNRIERAGLPIPRKEYHFHPERKWRFDFAYPDKKIAIECEGAVWTRGRHTRGAGFIGDCQKYNAAQLLGWKVLRYSSDMIDEVGKDLKIFFKR
ncbi:MAG: hypothetical protein C4540_04710 [Candidatus Omnitrophota bacterium]|nr:MAG: hypothetical protein C4540_04710 [Candidatus Omnitrophota bacterium]